MSDNVQLKDGERIDDLQREGYRIIQDPARFCFGMDAVLLSGFACYEGRAGKDRVSRPAATAKRMLDLGTGTGIIPILMYAKAHVPEIYALEIQQESADMARRSVELNGLSDVIRIVDGDIREAGNLFAAASFDIMTCNPPYMIANHGLQNDNAPKTIARHEVLCNLKDVVAAPARLLKPGGHFYMVHRPFRLTEILTELTAQGLEPKRMQLVYPSVDKEPNMVLIDAIRGAKSGMVIEKPLIVYGEQGKYTQEIYDIYGY